MRGFCSLASGSKGNSLYFGTGDTKFLIDAGLPARETIRRLAAIGVSIEDISAILISHEHSDHILGIKTLCQKYKIPVFANSQTADAICKIAGFTPDFMIFTTGEPFIFGGVEIFPFSITHDAIDPVGFILRFDSIKMGICTDCGFVTTLVKHHLKGCHYLFLEANHEPHMVHASPRPAIYKQRVLSRSGHLSNQQCKELVQELLHSDLKQVQLGHLSKECNHPATALEKVQQALDLASHKIDLFVVSQEKIGEKITFP